MHDEHQADVDDDVEDQCDESKKMEAPRDLPAAEQPGIPWIARNQGRRHAGAGYDHEWRNEKHDTRIG
jgi:hypothetical protein